MAFSGVQIRSTRNGSTPINGYREDLAAGDNVGLALTSSLGIATYRWEITGRPEGSSAGGSGPEPILLGTSSTAAFVVDNDVPYRRDGGYEVVCTVNQGTPTETRIRVLLVRLSGLVLADGRTLRRIAATESVDDDTSIATILQGYATALNRWLDYVRAVGSGGGTQTLAVSYAQGSLASDQTLVLTNADGGGLVIDASGGGFTGANALRVNSASDGPFVVSRTQAHVGIGTSTPGLDVHALGTAPGLRLERASGLALDIQNVSDELRFLNGGTIMARMIATGGLRADLGLSMGTAPATAPVLAFGDGAGAAVSAAGTGRVRYSAGAMEFSVNAGPWTSFAGAAYNTLLANGIAVTQRTSANFSTDFSVVDNGGATRTDVSLATVGGLSAGIVDRIGVSNTGRVTATYPTVVADVTALEALTGANYRDGNRVFVQSLGRDFVFRASNTSTVDHLTVASVSGMAGARWVTDVIGSRALQEPTAFYVKNDTGSDEADGLTSGTPLKTMQELARRLRGREISGGTTVNVLADVPDTDLPGFDFSPNGTTAATLTLQGTQTVVATGTVSGAIAPSYSTNVLNEATITGFNPASYVGYLVRKGGTSGASGTYSVIVANPSAGVARFGIFTVNGSTVTTGFANGDTVEVITGTKIPGAIVMGGASTLNVADATITRASGSNTFLNKSAFASVAFARCNIAPAVSLSVTALAVGVTTCAWRGGSAGGATNGSWSITRSAAVGLGGSISSGGYTTNALSDTVLYATRFIGGDGAKITLGGTVGFGVFGLTTGQSGVTAGIGGTIQEAATIFGSGNSATSYILAFERNAEFVGNYPPTGFLVETSSAGTTWGPVPASELPDPVPFSALSSAYYKNQRRKGFGPDVAVASSLAPVGMSIFEDWNITGSGSIDFISTDRVSNASPRIAFGEEIEFTVSGGSITFNNLQPSTPAGYAPLAMAGNTSATLTAGQRIRFRLTGSGGGLWREIYRTAASGDLAGDYPFPTVAAIHETGGPTRLPIGSIPSGSFLQNSSGTIVGTTTIPGTSVGLTAGQVGFGSPSNTLTGDNGLFWDNVNKTLLLGQTSSAVASSTMLHGLRTSNSTQRAVFQNSGTGSAASMVVYAVAGSSLGDNIQFFKNEQTFTTSGLFAADGGGITMAPAIGAPLVMLNLSGASGSDIVLGTGTTPTAKLRILNAGQVQIPDLGGGGYVKAAASTGQLSSSATIPYADITGAPAAITALTGDVTATGPGSVIAAIAANAVSDTKFRQSAGLSVVGRSTNSTGNVADITSSADGDVLQRSGTTLVFGALAYSKLSGTPTLFYQAVKDSAGATQTQRANLKFNARFAVADASPDTTVDLATIGTLTPGSYTNANLTVDAYGRITVASSGSGGGTVTAVTASAPISSSGGAAPNITLNVNGVTDSFLRQSGALSVIGRSANSPGNVADILAAAASDAVLRESGSTIGWGTVATGGIANNAVTDAKLRQSAGLSVVGRSANSAGNVADISASSDGDVLRRSGAAIGFGAIPESSVTNLVSDLAGKESVLTFSTGLARSVNTITANLSTGVSGGQDVIGGTVSGNALTLRSNTSNDGKIRFGNSGNNFFDEATGAFALGTSSPIGQVHVNKSTNGSNGFFFTNPNTGGSAYSLLALGNSATLGNAYWEAALFGSGSTRGYPYSANNAVIEIGQSTGNMVFWINQASGDVIWNMGTTYPNPTEVMRLSHAGTLTVSNLGTGVVGATSGALGLASTATIATALGMPSGNRVLAGTGTGFASSDEFRLDPADILLVGSGGAVAWRNGLATISQTNYDQVRGFFSSNVWNLKSEKGGTGTVRSMKIDADTATLTVAGDTVQTTATTNATTNATNVTLFGTSQVFLNANGGSLAPDIVLTPTDVNLRSNNVAASASNPALDAIKFGGTASLTGSTHVTTPQYFTRFDSGQLNTAALVDLSATVYISGSPFISSGGGTLNAAYSLYVGSGVCRFDGNGFGTIFEVPSNALGLTSTTAVARIPVLVTGVGLRYLHLYTD